MLLVTDFTPSLNARQEIDIPYREGIIEVLNDSQFAVMVSLTGGGAVMLPAYQGQIYAIPPSGATLTILPVSYMVLGVGPVSMITVNCYFPGELLGDSYPISLARSPTNNSLVHPHYFTGNLSAAGHVDLNPQVPHIIYCTGLSISIGIASAAQEVAFTLSNVSAGTGIQTYYLVTSTTQEKNLSVSFYPNPLKAADSTVKVSLQQATITATGNVSIAIYGYLE